MPALSLDTKEVQKMINKLFASVNVNRYQERFRRWMYQTMGTLKRDVQFLAAEEGPKGWTGHYFSKMVRSVHGEGFDLVGELTHDGVPWAIIVEEGRAPGEPNPPAEELVPWVLKKFRKILTKIRRDKIKAAKKEGRTIDPPSVDEMAFGFSVALSPIIGNQGTFQPGQTSTARKAERGGEPGMQHFERVLDASADELEKDLMDQFNAWVVDAFSG